MPRIFSDLEMQRRVAELKVTMDRQVDPIIRTAVRLK